MPYPYPSSLERQAQELEIDLKTATSQEKLHVFYRTVESLYEGFKNQEIYGVPERYAKVIEKDFRQMIHDIREISRILGRERSTLRDINKYLRKSLVKIGVVIKLFNELGNEDEIGQRADGYEKQMQALDEMQEALYNALQSWPKDLQ